MGFLHPRGRLVRSSGIGNVGIVVKTEGRNTLTFCCHLRRLRRSLGLLPLVPLNDLR